MRIAWCTPFSAASAIARVTNVVATELARHATVDVWYEPGPGGALATSLVTHPWLGDASSSRELRGYDAVIYSMGDHFGNHGAVYRALLEVPGVAIMHDASLANFFAAWFLLRGDRAGYLAAVGEHHGDEAAVAAQRRMDTVPASRWRPDPAHGLAAMVVDHVLGTVTHSRHAAMAMRSPLVPLRVLPLTYSKLNDPPLGGADIPATGGRVMMLMFGHIHEGRRGLAMVRALAAEPDLAEQAVLVFAGSIRDGVRTELETEIGRHGLGDAVRILGHVDDRTLEACISRADICIGLRNPIIEAASESVVEAMWHGRPVVVPDDGWYADLPRDSVVHVADEDGALRAALLRLVADTDERRAIGVRAQVYARASFTPAIYADGVRELIPHALATRPLLALTEDLRGSMRYLGLDASAPVRGALARAAGELFAERLPVVSSPDTR